MQRLICLTCLTTLLLIYYVGCDGDDPNGPDNHPPSINNLTSSPDTTFVNDTCSITCEATDADGDALTYTWTAAEGTILGTGSGVDWYAPDTAGIYYVKCTTSDGRGGSDTDSLDIVVRAEPMPSAGLVAHYPFNGNADDESGNGHDGTIFGANMVNDRFGNPNKALSFDGNDRIDVPDNPDLTFGSDPFTISVWAQLSAFGADGGYYLMGHDEGGGNTNKWIIWFGNASITFIIGPSPGWIYLGPAPFQLGKWYHLVIRRSGTNLEAFVDDSLIGSDTGPLVIPDPDTPFQIGTAEPENPNRGYQGLADDIRIYNRALDNSEIQLLYNEGGWGL